VKIHTLSNSYELVTSALLGCYAAHVGSYLPTFNVHGSGHRNNILIYKYQQDAHVTEFILSDNYSTCFGHH
jgi:hypothetical protein